MSFERLVIDAFKQAFSEYVATGEIDMAPLSQLSTILEEEIGKRLVKKQPTADIEMLKTDIDWLKYDLFEE